MHQQKKDEKKVVRGRSWVAALLVAAMATAILMQLASLQLRNGEAYALQSENRKTRIVALSGARGKILDSHGNALAFDEKGYDITFYRDPTHTSAEDRHAYTQAISEVIAVVERSGGTTIGGFALKPNPQGGWMFDFNTTDPTVFAKREELWRTNMSFKSNQHVDEIYAILCQRYGIDEAMPYEEAAKILAVWQESRNIAFLSRAVVVASAVPFGTVAEVMARSPELPGFDVVDSYVRRYPMGSLAAHIIGYESRIPDGRTEEYAEKGYASDALVGVAGIESSMESHLSGNIDHRQGRRVIEVNSQGKQISELEYIPPQAGSSVKLTLDAKLQNVVETALKNAIEGPIRTAQIAKLAEIETTDPKKYQRFMETLASQEREMKMAETGAAVVMDVHTGRVLALVSYPGYDLNIFSGGVDTKAYNALLEDKRLPLFHRAINGRYPPGSIFKMVTGLGGLMEGVITPTETITDAGPYTVYETNPVYAPVCWVSPGKRHTHASQDIINATLHSCNYYFYTVADRLGNDLLYNWASNLGLTSKTGIELPGEATSIVSSPMTLWNPANATNRQGTSKPILVQNAIINIIRKAGLSIDIEYDDERVTAAARKMLEFVTPYISMNEVGAEVRKILQEDLAMPNSLISSRGMVSEIDRYLLEIRWNGNEDILTGIGQSNTILTPIAVARYVSAIANNGTVYEAQIVDSILASDGTTVLKKEPVVASSLGDDPRTAEMLSYIHKGMKGVLSDEDGGTAAPYFEGFAYKDMMGGKTGTAQIAGNIEIENDGWFVSYFPYEDPEIAVVIVVENGLSGGLASVASKDIITYYAEQKNAMAASTLPEDWAWIE